MTNTIDIEPDPLSLRRLLGLLCLSIALILTISTLTNRRIELKKPELAVELRSLETKVEASSIEEVIPALAPEKPQEVAQAPEPVVVVETPPPVVQEPVKPAEPAKPAPKPKPVEPTPVEITGSKLDWLGASTIPRRDWDSANWLITRESSWNPNAQNPRSTAYGLKQFLDGTWAGVGCEKALAINNPVYQLNCGQKYVTARYGTWANALAFWRANHWY